jgi:hypothetical protein
VALCGKDFLQDILLWNDSSSMNNFRLISAMISVNAKVNQQLTEMLP